MANARDTAKRIEALSSTPALQKVSRWRIPNSDGEYKAAESIEFAKANSTGFFRAVRSALQLITAKKD